MAHTIDKSPNLEAGKPVKGRIITPDSCGVYDVSDVNTGRSGALIIFEFSGQRLQILIDEMDLSLLSLALNDVNATISTKNKPQNPKEVN